MKKGRRIRTLHQLAQAAVDRRSVIVTEGRWQRRYPAAVVMNRQAACVLDMLNAGIWINIPRRRVDLNKPPRKWVPYSPPAQPKPVLLLPYYPEIP